MFISLYLCISLKDTLFISFSLYHSFNLSLSSLSLSLYLSLAVCCCKTDRNGPDVTPSAIHSLKHTANLPQARDVTITDAA